MDEDRAFGNVSIGLVDPIRQVHSTLTPLVRCQARLILTTVRRLCGACAAPGRSATYNLKKLAPYRRAWDARGRNFKLYMADRPEPCAPKPSVHTELIHVDAGSKMSVSHRVWRHPEPVSQPVTATLLAGSR